MIPSQSNKTVSKESTKDRTISFDSFTAAIFIVYIDQLTDVAGNNKISFFER